MAQTITWLDKDDSQPISDPRKIVTDADMNQIKDTVNVNANELQGKTDVIAFVYGEVPSGTINGVNVTFNLSFTPVAGTLQLYMGLRLKAGDDYSITGATITMTTPPELGDNLLADYIKS